MLTLPDSCRYVWLSEEWTLLEKRVHSGSDVPVGEILGIPEAWLGSGLGWASDGPREPTWHSWALHFIVPHAWGMRVSVRGWAHDLPLMLTPRIPRRTMKRSSPPIEIICWMPLRWAWGQVEAESWPGGIAFGIPSLTCTDSSLRKLDFRCPSTGFLDIIRQIERSYAWMWGGEAFAPPFRFPDWL